ncbi:MAG: hypothetical protein QXV17_08040 [Candidatus Micrarchaeaceae archaeon]
MEIYCAVCDKYIKAREKVVISRYGISIEVDHNHKYLYLVSKDVVVPLTEEAEKLLKVLKSVKRYA